MSIQEQLGSYPEPYSPYHVMSRYSDSYSRMLDHEVGEWEQPYGYDVRPLEPEGYERMEMKYPKYPKAR